MSANPPSTSSPEPRSRRAILVALGAALLPALLAAAVAGFVVGGVGGRLAMYLLRVTSGPEVIGLESDDGFIIGRFSTDTLFLVFGVTVGATVLLGPAYALARPWIPARWRSLIFALFFALVGGGLLVHEDGIDFRVLSPRALAVALFVAIPAAFGAALEPLHTLAERWTARLPDLVLLGVLVLTSGVPILLGLDPDDRSFAGIGITLVFWIVLLVVPLERISQVLRARLVVWAGRIGMTVLAGLGSLDLAGDLRALF